MWASHDDTWSPTYISELSTGFELGRGVILSAGQTVYVNADGSRSTFPIAHAPPHELVEVEPLVTMLLQQHATSWFYGLYDRSMLVPLLARIQKFPGWGSDLLFLFHCCLNYRVVGCDAAKIFKRVRPGRSWASPANMEEWRAWKIEFTRHLVHQLIDANLPVWRKLRLVDEVTRYVWRMVIHLGNAPTVPQWALAQLGRVRREIRGISRRG
jgi:hypothetical protein